LKHTIAATLCFLAANGVAASQLVVPVMVGGEADYDACGGQGQVSGLDPQGDNFLTVRAGPAKRNAAIDRLRSGSTVQICDSSGNWIGIVYGSGCGTGSPLPKRQPYKGPCKSGWVFKKYVTVTAG
jgi:Bacterial SH3 domain